LRQIPPYPPLCLLIATHWVTVPMPPQLRGALKNQTHQRYWRGQQ